VASIIFVNGKGSVHIPLHEINRPPREITPLLWIYSYIPLIVEVFSSRSSSRPLPENIKRQLSCVCRVSRLHANSLLRQKYGVPSLVSDPILVKSRLKTNVRCQVLLSLFPSWLGSHQSYFDVIPHINFHAVLTIV
jgi:hypothetical protein